MRPGRPILCGVHVARYNAGVSSGISVREKQKRDRRQRIFDAAMELFAEHGFQQTTVLAIARAARVSRGTVFNYYPYKEAILLEHFANELAAMRRRIQPDVMTESPIDSLYRIFHELADFVEANHHLVLPLAYELLNPDPERSRLAYQALPLATIIREQLSRASRGGLVRRDYSRERLSRTVANTFFLTALQWAAYRHDRSIHSELETALKLMLEGILAAE